MRLSYQPPSYVTALSHLFAQINKPAALVGTSLGGICGMMLAAAQSTPVTRLVLNDIGPHIPAAALLRHPRLYGLDSPERFPTMVALEAHLRKMHAPFGSLSDAEWAHLARFSARRVPDPTGGGHIAMHYDPKIIEPIRATVPLDVDMWPIWDMIHMPRLVIRGAQSDLLLAETYERMLAEGAEGYVVTDAGHAPALMDYESQARIKAFLLGG